METTTTRVRTSEPKRTLRFAIQKQQVQVLERQELGQVVGAGLWTASCCYNCDTAATTTTGASWCPNCFA